MLPKLEVHFGNEVLHIPQTVRLNLVMFAYYKDTLKDNILESYKHRTGVVMREHGLRPTEITLEESESQLVKDLKEFGNDFVLEQVYLDCNMKVTYDTLSTPVDWISDEEELFERKVEEFEVEEIENKLPKLELHFGTEVLHVPQSKKVNLIMFAYKKDTLKENLLMCYRGRVADIRIAEGKCGYVNNISLEEAEAQLISDMKKFGEDFVFDVAWKEGDSEILGKSQSSFYEWISDEEEVFEDRVE